MKIHEQNSCGPFSDVINDWLQTENGGSFTCISAFAKSSGVGLLEEAIKKYKENGGRVTFIVGIDLDGTSYDALINLHELSDELYIVHSENIITFHPKIYFLDTPTSKKIAVGSNNLTVGGLYNNFEASIISENIEKDSEIYKNYIDIKNKFTDISDLSVKQINTKDDIEELLKNGYISTENQIIRKRIAKDQSNSSTKQSSITTPKIFGKKTIRKRAKNDINNLKVSDKTETTPVKNKLTSITSPVINIGEFTWFETGNMTGGSKNILDLSKKGTITSGKADGTVYFYENNQQLVNGGVIFFGIDPNSHLTTKNIRKDITIKYNGINYYPATIKYAERNSNWRLQIKGKNEFKEKITEKLESSLQNKVLVFEKINSDNYNLIVLDKDAITDLENQSIFSAKNGQNNPNGRRFGYITNNLEI